MPEILLSNDPDAEKLLSNERGHRRRLRIDCFNAAGRTLTEGGQFPHRKLEP
jgi:hypothetical protein